MCRDERGDECRDEQQPGRGDEAHGIERRDAVEQRLHSVRNRDGRDVSDDRAQYDRRQTFPDHEPQHAGRPRTERHADADLVGPARHEEADDPEDSEPPAAVGSRTSVRMDMTFVRSHH